MTASTQQRMLLWMLALLPIIAVFSGKAVVPLTIGMGAIAFFAIPRGTDKGCWKTLRGLDIRILALLWLWPALTVFWSIIPDRSARSALAVLGLMVCAVWLWRCLPKICATIAPSALYRPLMLGLALAAGLAVAEISGMGIVQGLVNFWRSTFSADGKVRLFEVTDMNRAANVIALMIWPAVMALLQDKRFKAAKMLPVLMLLPVSLLWSSSATLGLMVGIGIFLVAVRWPRVGTALVCGALPLFLLLWPVSFQTLGTPEEPQALYHQLPESYQHRIVIWHFVLDKALERPLTGWGMDASRSIPGGEQYFAPQKVYLPLHPHNNILQILLEQGLPGFFFSLLAIVLLTQAWRSHAFATPWHRAAMAAAMLTYLTAAMSGFGMWQEWWVAIACVTAVWMRGAMSLKPQQAAKATS